LFVHVYHKHAGQITKETYERLMEEFWSWRLEQVPEFSTTLGIREHDRKLESFTKEAFRKRKV